MYNRIEAQIALIGMSKKELAKKMNLPYNTLLLKLRGKSKFTLNEALKIKEITNSDESIEVLFEANSGKVS